MKIHRCCQVCRHVFCGSSFLLCLDKKAWQPRLLRPSGTTCTLDRLCVPTRALCFNSSRCTTYSRFPRETKRQKVLHGNLQGHNKHLVPHFQALIANLWNHPFANFFFFFSLLRSRTRARKQNRRRQRYSIQHKSSLTGIDFNVGHTPCEHCNHWTEDVQCVHVPTVTTARVESPSEPRSGDQAWP